jgi:ABC-type uncharacterized transport system involved in gliding motility auxiliary subunit
MISAGRSDLLAGQPKRNPNQSPYGGPPPDGPQKGDLKPLLRALGVEYRPDDVSWSDYNPSHYLRELIPGYFVWLVKDRGSIETKDQSTVTTGVDALLLPYPGNVSAAADKPSGMTITPLLFPASGSPWGSSVTAELTQPSFTGQLQIKRPDDVKRHPAADQTKRPALAVEISGAMGSAYPRLAPGTKTEEGKEAPKPSLGALSGKPARVILISDIDLIDNQFFQFYRDQGNQLGKQDELRALLDLKNVQFVANAVDTLMDDKAYLDLRTRRPARRPLTRIENVSTAALEERRTQAEAVQNDLQAKIDEVNSTFQDSLAKIDAREDLDEETKAHEKSRAQIVGQRRITTEINGLKLQIEKKERDLEIQQARTVERYQWWVKFLAVIIPSAVLSVIAVAVFINRLVAERSHIPAARRRQGA